MNNQEEVKTIKELKPCLKDYNLVAYEETAKQHEHGELFHTLQQLKAGDQLLIIVGCEGGFDESEIQELNERINELTNKLNTESEEPPEE